MIQQMYDTIAVSNKVGHPETFMTKTCNPIWREITDALLPERSAQDRQDIVPERFSLNLNLFCIR